MKILHIIPSYLPAYRYGGLIACIHNLNVGLVQRGVDVTVYTTSVNGSENLNVPLGTPVILDGVRVYYFKPGLLRGWFYSNELHKMLARTAKDFDLIHISSVFLFASTLGAYYAKKYKKPYIITPHGSLMRRPLSIKSFKKRVYIFLIERRNLMGAAAIHFTAPVEEGEYRDAGLPLIFPPILVPNSIYSVAESHQLGEDSFFKEWRVPSDFNTILFLGRISFIKGFDTLIPAFAEVVKKIPKTMLIIAGEDERGYKVEVEGLVGKYGLSNNVLFTGVLLDKKKEAAFRNADLFVLPSYSENFGMAVAEAMSFNLPVIITEGVAISDDVRRENAGVVVKKDKRELASAVVNLLENKARALEIGKRGGKFARTQFSMESVAEKMHNAYNKVVREYERANKC